MADLGDRPSDDSLSVSSLPLSQSGSSSSDSLTSISHATGGAFSLLRRARSVKDQLEIVNEAALPEEISQLPKIWMFNYPHLKVEWLHKKRKRWSKVDQYGERYVRLGDDNTSLGEYWLCNLCMQKGQTSLYATPNGQTSTSKGHLQKAHGLLIGPAYERAESDGSIPPHRRQKTLQESLKKVLTSKSTGQLFRETLLGWVTDANIPFTGIEHALFRQHLQLLNKSLLQELLPQSGDTVRTLVRAEFEAEKELLKNELANMHDEDDSVLDLAHRRRIRCVNHELNLGAIGFLDGTLKEVLKKLAIGSETRESLQKEAEFLEKWRQSGSVQRLHDLMGWIRRSPQRREQFLQLTRGELREEELLEFGQALWNRRELGGLMVKQDNATRWNSFFESAKRALQLKDPIEIFQQRMLNERDLKRRLPTEYSLGDDDWSFLCIAVDVLEPFFCLTKRFESREPRFAEVAASLHFLRDFLHRKRDIYSDGLANPEMSGPDFTGGSIFVGDQRPTLQPITPPNTQSELFANQPQGQRWQLTRHKEGASDAGTMVGVDHGNSGGSVSFSDGQNLRALRASLTIAIGKMDKYIATLEDSPAYWAAMILHPGLKKRWIEKYLP
ncbi:hypothetical protein RAB80_010137 [Fusarium oxysporum f. sp. vasinfectum]|nr:hypothetical protein RAB80_010137 [Fusarium oxysporum f. sp. vasinfectum]